jgi:dihydrofolate reductase
MDRRTRMKDPIDALSVSSSSMGEIVLFIAASLDGYIADPHGGVAWLERFNVEGEDHGYAQFLSGVDTVIMGAKTYEQELSRVGWPYGARPTWVFTHRQLLKPAEGSVRFLSGSVTDHVADIRKTTDRTIYLVGGADLAQQFMAVGAVDQLRLFVVPLTLGKGIRLFEDVASAAAELLGARSYRTGLVELVYHLRGSR